MPQTTWARARRWRSDDIATKFLMEHGYTLQKDWSWKLPTPDHMPSREEKDAVAYMIEEWDYDGIDYPEGHPLADQ